MMRASLAVLLCLIVTPPAAEAEADPIHAAEAAATALGEAAGLLAEAERSRDRVAALTETVRAYEAGLRAMREGMRRAALREREIRAEFDREEEQLSALLGALSSMQTSPEALILLHPSGPLASVRAGMILSDVTPALNARVTALRSQLQELSTLRVLQESAKSTLDEGVAGVQTARTELSQAISNRVTAPDASETDRATIQALVNSADTLQGFAASLATVETESPRQFVGQKGTLPLPVSGRVIAGYKDADAAGVRRPGLLIATAPLSLVTTPYPATVRYSGPLLDSGEVVILEPEAGYLLVLAGLAQSFPELGAVLDPGAPVGLMGGTETNADQILIETREGGGQPRPETLYIELRQGDTTLDPAEWFELMEE